MPVYVAAVAVDPCDCGLADYIRFILEGNARMPQFASR